MGERWEDIKAGVRSEARDHAQQQRSAWRATRQWCGLAVLVALLGLAIALVGSGILDTIGPLIFFVGFLLVFVWLWKFNDAGGDDYGASTGAAIGAGD